MQHRYYHEKNLNIAIQFYLVIGLTFKELFMSELFKLKNKKIETFAYTLKILFISILAIKNCLDYII